MTTWKFSKGAFFALCFYKKKYQEQCDLSAHYFKALNTVSKSQEPISAVAHSALYGRPVKVQSKRVKHNPAQLRLL